MSTNGLKSSTLHPYQRNVYLFWRRPENKGFYSEAVREEFERKKMEFDMNCKYYQWEVKPQILLKAEHLEAIFKTKWTVK